MIEKVDEYMGKYNSFKYLALPYSNGKHEQTIDSIRYFVMLKINIADVYSHKYTKAKIKSDDDLPLEKTLNTHNIVRIKRLSNVFRKIVIFLI